jgi:hypothetical protein
MEPKNLDSLRDNQRTGGRSLFGPVFPDPPNVEPPLDWSLVGPRDVVAPRVTFRRSPPVMPFTEPGIKPLSTPIGNTDVVMVSSLPTQELAYRLATLAARIEKQVQQNGTAGAVLGLGMLAMQVRMFEHLHILQSTAGDVS